MDTASPQGMAAQKIFFGINEFTIWKWLDKFNEQQYPFVINFNSDNSDKNPNNTEILSRVPAKYQDNLLLLQRADSKTRTEYFQQVLLNPVLTEEHVVDPEIALVLLSPSNAKPGHVVTQFAKLQALENREAGIGYKALPCSESDEEMVVTKYVPNKASLKSSLKDFKNEELLTIFDKAEQALFSLAIGRGLYGINGDTFADGMNAMSSPWRYALFVTGDPGIGKSVLMSNIQEASEKLGYTSSEFNNLGKQFGLGDIISTDFAMSDDLKAETLYNVLSSPSFKSIVSGAKVRTEQKFKNESEVQARAVIIANINRFPAGLLYKLDEGVLNRIKVLKCKPASSLPEEDKTYFVIQRLIKKYKCTKQELFNAFFRNCVDEYVKHLTAGDLKQAIDTISIDLNYKLPVQIQQGFAELLQLASITANPNAVIIPELNGASFREAIKSLHWFVTSDSCHEARNLLKQNWLDNNKSPEHSYLLFKSIDVSGLTEAYMSAEALQDSSTGNLNKVLKDLLTTLRLKDGFKIAALQDEIVSAWGDAKFGLRKKYLPICEQLEALNLKYSACKNPLKYLSASYSRKQEYLNKLAS